MEKFNFEKQETTYMEEIDSVDKEKIPNHEKYIEALREKGFDEHTETYKSVITLSELVKKENGNAYLVGGCVRDMIVGKISKDFDIEIHGLQAEKIEEIASNIGKVSDVGKSFGILKITLDNGLDLDTSKRIKNILRP